MKNLNFKASIKGRLYIILICIKLKKLKYYYKNIIKKIINNIKVYKSIIEVKYDFILNKYTILKKI